MPFYAYKCSDCGEGFELLRKYEHREAQTVCLHCSSNEVKYIPSFKTGGVMGLPNGYAPTRSKSREKREIGGVDDK